MKHRAKGRKFGRVKNQRRALLRGLLNNLIICEKIVTTEAKAKEIKAMIDRIISKTKKIDEKNKIAVIRNLKKVISNEAVKKISGDFSKKFEGRKSGYSRITKLGRRKGDSAKMAVIEFV